MRGKRSKQYRKLMHHYERSFNFREPYQVLVDAQMIQDAARFSMNLAMGLERTLHAKVKPMITQCCIRHLYTAESDNPAAKNAWIDTAKTFERRRCNHHTLPEPLSAQECITSVVDPKSSGTNKNRYVVASQDQKIRAHMRTIPGVPLIYINRSVMIMEPMAAKTEEVRDMEERSKVRAGLKPRRGQDLDSAPLKRKRDENGEDEIARDERPGQADGESTTKKRKKGGPKAPNPLSVKKSKKKSTESQAEQDKQVIAKLSKRDPQAAEKALPVDAPVASTADGASEEPAKKKRRRKHKSAADAGGNAGGDADRDATADQALVAEA